MLYSGTENLKKAHIDIVKVLISLNVFVCFIFAPLALATNKLTDSPLRIVTFPIPLMVESESEGLFIELAKAIETELGVTFHIEVWPTPRAIQYFNEGRFDILFPGLETLFHEPNTLLRSSELMYIKKDFVFTLKNTPQVRSVQDLEGLTVGLTRSYPYAQSVLQHENVDFVYVNSDEQNAQMLVRNRIDAFIAEESSGVQAFKNTGLLPLVHYASSSPVSSQDVYFALHQTKRGALLEKQLSKVLSKLKQNGQFTRIMSGAITTGLDENAASAKQ